MPRRIENPRRARLNELMKNEKHDEPDQDERTSTSPRFDCACAVSKTIPFADISNGVVAWLWNPDTTPLGLRTALATTQGSSYLATLGWKTQSLWDCGPASLSIVPRGISSSENF